MTRHGRLRLDTPLVKVLMFGLCALLTLACGRAQPDDDGKLLFASVCARCHGIDGRGGTSVGAGAPAPRNFHDTVFQQTRSDQQLRDTIVNGKGGWMPAFGVFDEAQLRALVRHVRRFDPTSPAVEQRVGP